MKNKKRLFCFLIGLLTVCAVIRIGNIGILAFGDNAKRTAYMASFSGTWFLRAASGTKYFKGFGIDYGPDFTLDPPLNRDFTPFSDHDDIWLFWSLFDIHNFTDEVDRLYFYMDDYFCTVSIKDKRMSFGDYDSQKGEFCKAYFTTENGKIFPLGSEDKAMLDAYPGMAEKVAVQAEIVFAEYEPIIKHASRIALFCQTGVLILCVVCIVLLVRWCQKHTKDVINESSKTLESRKCSLNYGLLEALLYSFLIEFALAVIIDYIYFYGSGISFFFLSIYWGIIYFIPAYLITLVVIFSIYFIARIRLKKTYNLQSPLDKE